nr:MAG TPA: hypothetical protein [Caudoviricetes sp.]
MKSIFIAKIICIFNKNAKNAYQRVAFILPYYHKSLICNINLLYIFVKLAFFMIITCKIDIISFIIKFNFKIVG